MYNLQNNLKIKFKILYRKKPKEKSKFLMKETKNKLID